MYNTRYEMGRQLAREAPIDADIVVPVPDSGLVAALGYSAESGIPIGFRFDPQPLRRTHFHRTEEKHPSLRREGKAESRPQHPSKQARCVD